MPNCSDVAPSWIATMGRATPVNWLPKTEIDCPVHSFRKSRCRQSVDFASVLAAMPGEARAGT